MNTISQCGFHPERTDSAKNRNAERSSSGSLWRKSLPPAAGPFPWQRMSPAFSRLVPWYPKSLKAWTPTQRTLLWALCHFPTAKLLLSHIYPHSSSFRQIIIFSLKQCLVLVTTTLKWNLWRYCLIKNVTEHQVSLLLWIQRPLPPHPNIQKESAVPTF